MFCFLFWTHSSFIAKVTKSNIKPVFILTIETHTIPLNRTHNDRNMEPRGRKRRHLKWGLAPCLVEFSTYILHTYVLISRFAWFDSIKFTYQWSDNEVFFQAHQSSLTRVTGICHNLTANCFIDVSFAKLRRMWTIFMSFILFQESSRCITDMIRTLFT